MERADCDFSIPQSLGGFVTGGVTDLESALGMHLCDRVYPMACCFVMISDSQPHSWQR